MRAEQFRARQAPLKEAYRCSPEAARVTLSATGRIGTGMTCRVETGRALVEAGLHPATGGTGMEACSGDMVLEALVACAGVTLGAVATALDIELRDAVVTAEGELDFRGPLGVSKDVPVGFERIRLEVELDTDASDDAGGHAVAPDRAVLRRGADAQEPGRPGSAARARQRPAVSRAGTTSAPTLVAPTRRAAITRRERR